MQWRRGLALSPLAATLLMSLPAQATDVQVFCDRLDTEAGQELSARARLTLRAVPPGRAPTEVLVRCTW